MSGGENIINTRVILGIDPGTQIMGFGIIRADEKNPTLLEMGVIRLPKGEDHFIRMEKIFTSTLDLIHRYKPTELAIEAPFYGKNIQSMLKLGRAQGVAISAALSRKLPIFEYAPRKIKMAITGQGAASKEQVAGFLKSILKFDEIPVNLDATDGLAAAMCHYYQRQTQNKEKSYSGWDDFLKKNQGRIK